MTQIPRFFAIQVLLVSLALAAPPINDAFSSATVVGPALPATRTGNAREATYQANEPILNSESRNGSIWFKWAPTAAGTGFVVPTFTREDTGTTIPGSGFEMLVHQGTTLAGLTTLARGEEAAPIQRYAFQTGQTYYIQVFVNTDTLNATFPWKLVMSNTTAAPTPPANDAFASATTIAAGVPGTAAGTTVAATIESGESIDNHLTRSVWFKYTTTTAVSRLFTLTPDVDDSLPKAEIFIGSRLTTLSRVGWIDSFGETLIPLAASTTYHIRVFNEDAFGYSVPGTFSLEISDFSVGAPPDNDAFTNATDLGAALDDVNVLHPAGGVVDSAIASDFVQISGTPGNGAFSTSLTIPVGAAAGSYPLVIHLRDGSEDTDYPFGSTGLITDRSPLYGFWPTYADIPNGPDALTVTNSGTADALPTLTSFTVSPTSADVATSAPTFTFTAVVTDAQGVASVSVDWNDPNENLVGQNVGLTRTTGPASNGTWTGALTIPRYSHPGRIDLTLLVTDSIGQTRQFGIQPVNFGLRDRYNGRLQEMSNSFITLNNTVGSDVFPPQISEVTITPNPATFGSGGTVDVTVSGRVKDSQSGTDEVYFALGSNAVVLLPRISGTAADGVYGGTVTINRVDSGPGVHVSLFTTYDLRGNEGLISSLVPGIAQITLLAPAVGTCNAWAFNSLLPPPLDVPSATAQADGISNALKFAFNLDPTQSILGAARTLTPGTGVAGLPSITKIGSGPTNRLRMEYIRRIAAPGLSYSAEFGSILGVWTSVTGGTVSAINSQWERVVVEDSAGARSPIRFGRVKVIVPP
jgi:hypothetical protein